MEKHTLVLQHTEIPYWLCFSVLQCLDCTLVFSSKNMKGDYPNLSEEEKLPCGKNYINILWGYFQMLPVQADSE